MTKYRLVREDKKEILGAIVLAVLMIGLAWCTVEGQKVKRAWAELEAWKNAEACMIPLE